MIINKDRQIIIEALENIYMGTEWVFDNQDLYFIENNEKREPTENELQSIIDFINKN